MKSTLNRRPAVAAAILAISTILYLYLCRPAIYRRGYPPLDPWWMAMTWLWPGGIVLSAIFDRSLPKLQDKQDAVPIDRTCTIADSNIPLPILDYQPKRPQQTFRFLSRGWQLTLYAVATATIDACTYLNMVPRRLNFGIVLMDTLLFAAPMHMFATIFVEWFSQFALAPVRTLQEKSETVEAGCTNNNWRVAIALSAILALCISFPWGYASVSHAMDRYAGRKGADADWIAGEARVYSNHDFDQLEDDVHIRFNRDPISGLETHSDFGFGFEPAYNERIQELLKIHAGALPPSAVMPPSTHDMIAMLNTKENFVRIEKFPHQVNANIALTYDTSLSIVTPNGIHGVGGRLPVEVGRSSKYPNAVFIRIDKTLMAFSEDGRDLASATRME